MFFILYLSPTLYTMLVFFWVVNTITEFNLYTKCSLPDLTQRLVSNNFFINNLYFFWTSLSYLLIFFLVLILLLLLYRQAVSILLICKSIVILYILVYYFEFLSNNNFNYELLTYSDSVNNLLLNSVNRIHPLLLYVSGSFFIIFYKYTNCQNFFLFSFFLKKAKIFLLTLFFTLFLGSWWALQEGSWGGWWNWDISEVFGLFIGLSMLYFFHNIAYVKNINFLKVYFIFYFLKVIVFYLFIQLNFSLISHNFGFHISKFTSTETLLFNVFLFFVSYLFFFFRKFLKYLTYSLFSDFYIVYYKFLIQLTFSSLILITFNTVINDFIWSSFSINVFNFSISFNYLLLIIFIILYHMLTSFSSSLIATYSFFLASFLIPNQLFIFFRKLTYSIILHHFTLYIVLICLLYNYLLISLWENTNPLYSINDFFLFSKTSKNLYFNSNFIGSATTPESKSFYLISNKLCTYQTFLPTGFWSNFYISVEDMLSFFIEALIIILYLTYLYSLNLRVIFE